MGASCKAAKTKRTQHFTLASWHPLCAGPPAHMRIPAPTTLAQAAYKLLAAAPDAFDVVCSDSDAQAVRDGKGRRTLLDCRSLLGPAGRWKWHVSDSHVGCRAP